MLTRTLLLIVLLLSLCISRGEGVHIFPFAEGNIDTGSPSILSTNGAGLYGHSIFPQDGLHGQKLAKICSDGIDNSAGCPGKTHSISPCVLIDALTAAAYLIVPRGPKFLLASGSDRSPPPSFLI